MASATGTPNSSSTKKTTRSRMIVIGSGACNATPPGVGNFTHRIRYQHQRHQRQSDRCGQIEQDLRRPIGWCRSLSTCSPTPADSR